MVNRILKEVSTLEDIGDTTRDFVLLYAHRVEMQRPQKSGLHEMKEAKDFDAIK